MNAGGVCWLLLFATDHCPLMGSYFDLSEYVSNTHTHTNGREDRHEHTTHCTLLLHWFVPIVFQLDYDLP